MLLLYFRAFLEAIVQQFVRHLELKSRVGATTSATVGHHTGAIAITSHKSTSGPQSVPVSAPFERNPDSAISVLRANA